MLRLIFYPNCICLLRIRCTVFLNYFPQKYLSSLNNVDKNSKSSDLCNDMKIPDPPTNCCMSGCPTCVWIEYAEELTKIFQDSGEKTRHIVMSKVTDENMKAFLNMELKLLAKRLSDDKDGNTNEQ